MPDTKWSFWKDEAKLSILDTEQHLKFAVWVLGGILTFILPFAIGESVFKWDPSRSLVVSVCTIAVVWPGAIAIDMGIKGAKAGLSLKESADSLRVTAENGAERFKAAKALTQVKTDLQAIVRFGDQHVVVSQGGDLHKAMAEFVDRLKGDVRGRIEECDRRTSGIPGMSLDTEGLDGLIDSHAICEYTRRKIKLIDTFLNLPQPS
jgi:hypothetical protein